MENQTRFNLNAAVESWRQELAAQPNLASDDRRELETHLRDAVAGFQQRGLNEEESFWLARRRVGQPLQLSEEFEKADPAKVWRERVFWMVLAGLCMSLWSSLVDCIFFRFPPQSFLGLLFSYGYMLLFYLPPIGLAVFLAKGRLTQCSKILVTFFRSRWRLAICAVIFIIFTKGYVSFTQYRYYRTDHEDGAITLSRLWFNIFSETVWPLMLVVVATWLMPAQNRKTPKRA
jgi:hypothetical protein